MCGGVYVFVFLLLYRMMALIKKTNASFDEEKFRSRFKVASTHSSNPKNALDKITQGKVDASVKVNCTG